MTVTCTQPLALSFHSLSYRAIRLPFPASLPHILSPAHLFSSSSPPPCASQLLAFVWHSQFFLSFLSGAVDEVCLCRYFPLSVRVNFHTGELSITATVRASAGADRGQELTGNISSPSAYFTTSALYNLDLKTTSSMCLFFILHKKEATGIMKNGILKANDMTPGGCALALVYNSRSILWRYRNSQAYLRQISHKVCLWPAPHSDPVRVWAAFPSCVQGIWVDSVICCLKLCLCWCFYKLPRSETPLPLLTQCHIAIVVSVPTTLAQMPRLAWKWLRLITPLMLPASCSFISSFSATRLALAFKLLHVALVRCPAVRDCEGATGAFESMQASKLSLHWYISRNAVIW